MPSRKQRRRREKLQRHEWELVHIDEEGNETIVDAPETNKEERPRGRAKATRSRSRRPVREVKPPSWTRAAKRAALFAPLLYLFLSFGKHAPPVLTRVGISVLYAAVFVPMFFFVDRMAYRAYRRRVGG